MTVQFLITTGILKLVLPNGFLMNFRKKCRFSLQLFIGLMTPWGSCSIPKSWKIYYKNTEGKWLPVENLNAYSIVKGEGSAVKFKTVKTKAIKLEVVLHDEKTAGIYEWQIK